MFDDYQVLIKLIITSYSDKQMLYNNFIHICNLFTKYIDKRYHFTVGKSYYDFFRVFCDKYHLDCGEVYHQFAVSLSYSNNQGYNTLADLKCVLSSMYYLLYELHSRDSLI